MNINIINNINNSDIKKEQSIENSQINHINNPQSKTINQNYTINNQYKNNNNIKVNIKKRAVKINKLFINNNKLPIINKLPKNILNLKKINRNRKSTSINNSKVKNFKNILDFIKQQSLKPSINIINKSNIIHHHTNITNTTQKNYFSNVIINNYKTKDDRNNYSSSINKPKELDISEIKNENEKKIINNYIQKNNIPRLNLDNKIKNNNWKFKNNLQKIILKEDILSKDINKFNSQKKNSTDILNIISKDDDKIHNFLTIREKKPDNQNKDNSAIKTNPSTNDKKKRRFKDKFSNFNYKINNNINYYSKKKAINNSENSLNSFGLSLLSSNNLDFINNSKKEKENKYINSFYLNNKINNINTNNSVESKPTNMQNTLYRKKKLDKILNTNINLNLNIEQKLKRNKINNSTSIENNCSNRSYNYNYNKNKIDINKINNNSNIIYTNSNNNTINSGIKKVENIKKNGNLYHKSNLSKKCPTLNLKEIFGITNLSKKEKDINNASLNAQKQIQSQRNKPTSITSNTQNNININNYLHPIKNNNKVVNTFFTVENDPNLNFKSNFEKFKSNQNQNNLRNKDLINLNININFNRLNKSNINNVNMTSDSIKVNNELIKKQNSINSNQNNNNTINATSNYNINLNSKNQINKKTINRINTNIYLDKYIESKKLFSSLRKRVNFQSNIMNNNTTYNYIDKKIQNNNNSLINNYNSKQYKNNNTIDNKNSLNYSNLKKNHKKIKSMKEAIINKSNKNKNTITSYITKENNSNLKSNNLNNNLNLNGIGVYICNTDTDSITVNTGNYINIIDKFNTIDNNYHSNQNPFSNINNLKQNNIIKRMKLNDKLK